MIQLQTPNIDNQTRDLLTMAARRIEIAFWQEDFDRVERIIDEAKDVWAEFKRRGNADLDDPISLLGLPMLVVNSLESIGIDKIGQLLWLTYDEFRTLPHCGDGRWKCVLESLRMAGYEHGENKLAIRRLAKNGFRARNHASEA